MNILRFLCGAQRVFSVNFFFLLRENFKLQKRSERLGTRSRARPCPAPARGQPGSSRPRPSAVGWPAARPRQRGVRSVSLCHRARLRCAALRSHNTRNFSSSLQTQATFRFPAVAHKHVSVFGVLDAGRRPGPRALIDRWTFESLPPPEVKIPENDLVLCGMFCSTKLGVTQISPLFSVICS